jgi:hypothetical protein
VSGARPRAFVCLILAAAIAGCGGQARKDPFASLPADERPLPAGRGPRYRLPAVSAAVARRAVVGGLECAAAGRTAPRPYAVHLELYADGLVLPVPAGIGVAPPQRRRGAYVLGGACAYPPRTLEPTGVVLVAGRRGAPAPTLASLFALWGQRLSRGALASFRGPVRAFLGGRAWSRPPGAIPLRRHAQIVLEVGAPVLPHRAYRFPPGL